MNMSKCFIVALVTVAVVAVFAGCATTPRPAREPETSALPPSAKTLYAMAQALGAKGRVDQAEAVLRRLLIEHPDFIPAYADLAELCMLRGDHENAQQVVAIGLERAPADPVLLNNSGVLAVLRSDYATALEHFSAASLAVPGRVRYRMNMALALGMLGRDEESRAMYCSVLTQKQAEHNLETIRQMRGSPVAEEAGQTTSASVYDDAADSELESPAPTENAASPERDL